MERRARTLTLAAVVSVLILASCAGGSEESEPDPRPPERPEAVPELPPGWERLDNASQGYALGLPPGWREGTKCLDRGSPPASVTTICSPDRLATVQIFVDRTSEALELSAEEFASQTVAGLEGDGYRRLRAGRPKPFPGHYRAARVSGTGLAASTGVRQAFTLIVLRRAGVANFTALVAVNAERGTPGHQKLAERAVRTLRSRPVGTS